jgi:hypothetical protein
VRVGEKGIEKIFKSTIKLALDQGVVSSRSLQKVIAGYNSNGKKYFLSYRCEALS